jgi:tRNA threonylcarbamoyladenosine biosynthesis protein TsaE
MDSIERHLPDAAATDRLGAALAERLAPGCVIYLQGDLGAGKTSLARGFLRGLGVSGPVKSPTYTLIESYPVDDERWVHHLDLYRLADPEELEWIGLRDLLTGAGTLMIEWPERGAGHIPAADLIVALGLEGEGRRAVLSGNLIEFLQDIET